jgi:hypothetical protein
MLLHYLVAFGCVYAHLPFFFRFFFFCLCDSLRPPRFFLQKPEQQSELLLHFFLDFLHGEQNKFLQTFPEQHVSEKQVSNLAVQVGERVGHGVGGLVGGLVGGGVGGAVGPGVGSGVGAAVGALVGGKVGATVGKGVLIGDILGDPVGAGFATVGRPLGAAFGCRETVRQLMLLH